MQIIATAVPAGVAGLVGWHCRASSKMASLVTAAGGVRPQGTGQQGTDWRSRARWALAAASATGIVAANLAAWGHNGWPQLARWALTVWAGALAIVALIDQESLVIPTKLVRAAIVATVALLVPASLGTGDWRHLWHGVVCACIALGLFGAWAAINPRGLGFGDVRMATLVALGAGTLSVPGSLAALACSSLVAGLVSKRRAGRDPGPEAGAVALGPYLALGGLTVVMAHAY
jgi:leader peptidase (prepilin peptidase)/N-methyltransferase